MIHKGEEWPATVSLAVDFSTMQYEYDKIAK